MSRRIETTGREFIKDKRTVLLAISFYERDKYRNKWKTPKFLSDVKIDNVNVRRKQSDAE